MRILVGKASMIENRRDALFLGIALFFSCLFTLLVMRGLSGSNLVWLEVFTGVAATMILFIYRDRDRLRRLFAQGAKDSTL